MHQNAKIYVAGHRGLVGGAVVRELSRLGYRNIITRTRQELDLCDQTAVATFFAQQRPEYVVLAAAKVGGIYANSHYPADFITQNLMIQTNVIHQAKEHQVKRLIFLGSSCIYPRNCQQPIRESYLMTGVLESTNRPYAIAKIAGIEMCWSYNRQFDTQFLAVMPTNLYGTGDNYDLKTSHVIPALIRKMHEAKINGSDEVEIWGTGKPKREFLNSDDLANAIVFLLNLDKSKYEPIVKSTDEPPLLNIGCGEDLTIAALVDKIACVVGYEGCIIYNTQMPDGTPRKVLDVEKINALGWRASTSLEEGLGRVYGEFVDRQSHTKESE